MNMDGSDVRQITHPPTHTVDDQPDWSPDGKRLTFFSCQAQCHLWVVNADGTGRRRLTPCKRSKTSHGVSTACEDGQFATFAPDGQHVTFTMATVRRSKKSHRNQIQQSIAIIGADGKGERVIYRSPIGIGDIDWPALSPDGKLLVYEFVGSKLAKPRFGHALFVLNAHGRGIHRVTPWSLHAGDGPDWAPDGSRLLFRSNEDTDKQSQYYTVRPDGTGLTQLTDFPQGTQIFSATYSPDGSQIVFAKADANGPGDLWAMNADGTNQHPVLQAPPWDSAPDWGSAAG
jgi:TolB protein